LPLESGGTKFFQWDAPKVELLSVELKSCGLPTVVRVSDITVLSTGTREITLSKRHEIKKRIGASIN